MRCRRAQQPEAACRPRQLPLRALLDKCALSSTSRHHARPVPPFCNSGTVFTKLLTPCAQFLLAGQLAGGVRALASAAACQCVTLVCSPGRLGCPACGLDACSLNAARVVQTPQMLAGRAASNSRADWKALATPSLCPALPTPSQSFGLQLLPAGQLRPWIHSREMHQRMPGKQNCRQSAGRVS